VEDAARPEPAPRRLDLPRDAPWSASVADETGPPHLADPRALTILTTEHWGLLTARSLVYNEAFSRGAMFLTFLSASLVALGFVYQGGGAGPDFPLVLIAFLGLDLFIGLATLGRLVAAGTEEFQTLQAMNRLRHAYLEMVPAVDLYLSASPYDDAGSVLAVYGASAGRPNSLASLAHGMTTMMGMVSVLNASLAGALAAAVGVALGAEMRPAVIVGVGGGLAMLLALLWNANRVFRRRFFPARFPAPGADQATGRRNT
jgi:small basic protein